MGRLFAQLEYKVLQRDGLHGLVADEQMAQLGQEKLNFLITEFSQLGAEEMVDADVGSVPAAIRQKKVGEKHT